MGSKPEGVVRIIFERFYWMSPWKTRNEKIVQERKFSRRIEANIYCGSELRAN